MKYKFFIEVAKGFYIAKSSLLIAPMENHQLRLSFTRSLRERKWFIWSSWVKLKVFEPFYPIFRQSTRSLIFLSTTLNTHWIRNRGIAYKRDEPIASRHRKSIYFSLFLYWFQIRWNVSLNVSLICSCFMLPTLRPLNENLCTKEADHWYYMKFFFIWSRLCCLFSAQHSRTISLISQTPIY